MVSLCEGANFSPLCVCSFSNAMLALWVPNVHFDFYKSGPVLHGHASWASNKTGFREFSL